MTAILLIDASLQGVSMGICDTNSKEHTPIWYNCYLEHMSSATAIAPMLTEGLDKTGLSTNELGGICVSVGPGSFTGIKVGLAFSYGLSRVSGKRIPFLGVESLGLAAAELSHQSEDRDLNLFLPSTRTHGFVATVKAGVTSCQLVDVTSSCFADGLSGDDWCVVGEWDALTNLEDWSNREGKQIKAYTAAVCAINGMSRRSRELFPNEFEAQLPEARYMRLSTAEEKRSSAANKESRGTRA